MRRQDGVDSEAMAVLGGSRGGELALLRGTTFFEIHATVAYVPVDLQWEGMGQPGKDLTLLPRTEFTRDSGRVTFCSS